MDPAQVLVASRVIGAALMLGVLMIAGVLIGLAGPPELLPVKPPTVLTPLLAGAVVLKVLMSLIVPRLITGQQIKSLVRQVRRMADEAGGQLPSSEQLATVIRPRLPAFYFSQRIMGWAMLEGACLLAMLAYFLEGRWVAFLVLAVLNWTVMAAQWPTRRALDRFVDQGWKSAEASLF